jgi:hypothetical protein
VTATTAARASRFPPTARTCSSRPPTLWSPPTQTRPWTCYERVGGVTKLVSDGTGGQSGGESGAFLEVTSADGTHAVLRKPPAGCWPADTRFGGRRLRTHGGSPPRSSRWGTQGGGGADATLQQVSAADRVRSSLHPTSWSPRTPTRRTMCTCARAEARPWCRAEARIRMPSSSTCPTTASASSSLRRSGSSPPIRTRGSTSTRPT